MPLTEVNFQDMHSKFNLTDYVFTSIHMCSISAVYENRICQVSKKKKKIFTYCLKYSHLHLMWFSLLIWDSLFTICLLLLFCLPLFDI